MFTLDFSSSPAPIGRALGLIPQLCTTTERWVALGHALDAVRHPKSTPPSVASRKLDEVAKILINDTASIAKAGLTINIGTVTFELPQGQHVAISPFPATHGWFSVHARLNKSRISWIVDSLLKDNACFTGMSDPSEKNITVEDATSRKNQLSRATIGRLYKEFQEPGNLAGFYDQVFSRLPELFLYSAAFLAVKEKWDRRDWAMHQIIDHVRRVLVETESCAQQQMISVFPWVDTEPDT